MSDTSQQLQSPAAAPQGASLGDGSTLWGVLDDLALGCECANPALQIERWSQEAQPGLRAG